jgi:hypothetical protein
MPIFVILPKNNAAREAVRQNVETLFPNSLVSGAWLVSAAGTSEEISNTLRITGEGTDHTAPSVIVFTISGYFGRAPNNVWEWLTEKMSGGMNG